jgi:hypothetical protein
MNPFAAGEFFQCGTFWAFSGDNERNMGHMPQAADEDIEGLVGVQATKGQ